MRGRNPELVEVAGGEDLTFALERPIDGAQRATERCNATANARGRRIAPSQRKEEA
jgi:hypothetical protein